MPRESHKGWSKQAVMFSPNTFLASNKLGLKNLPYEMHSLLSD